jgi:uncharacterized protein YukE
MSQIKADTDALRATVAAMRQGSSAIENALQQAAQAMATLQNSRWSGNHRQQAEEIWTRLQAQFAPTIEALNQIANRTERFTNALEEAGRVFGDGSVSASGINPVPPWIIPDFPRIPDLPPWIIPDLRPRPYLPPWLVKPDLPPWIISDSPSIMPYLPPWLVKPDLPSVWPAPYPGYPDWNRIRELLIKPINNTIDALWQGQFDKALPTFWESTVDIGEKIKEYLDAAGDRLAIIGAAASEKLAPVIDQTGQALKDSLEESATAIKQAQEQLQRALSDSVQRLFGPLFKL